MLYKVCSPYNDAEMQRLDKRNAHNKLVCPATQEHGVMRHKKARSATTVPAVIHLTLLQYT